MRQFTAIVVVLAFVFVSLCGAPASIHAQAKDRANFTVGTATAARGRKATGTIEVPAGTDAALSIPVAVFHGAQPGPVGAYQGEPERRRRTADGDVLVVVEVIAGHEIDRLARGGVGSGVRRGLRR